MSEVGKLEEHCQETNCDFHKEGDNRYYWRHRIDGKCKVGKDFLAITEPLWNKEIKKEIKHE